MTLACIKRLQIDRNGQSLAEYGLIVLLIAIAVMLSVGALGAVIPDIYTSIVEQIDAVD